MSNDALERLKQRTRPTVNSRDTVIQPPASSTAPPNQPEQVLDIETSRYLESNDDQVPRPQPAIAQTSEETGSIESSIQKSTSQDIQVSKIQDISKIELKTKQTTLRLEVGISQRLQSLGRDHGLSREVLLESMFEFCEVNPDVFNAVLNKAHQKQEVRQLVANQKRARSMMNRFSES